jgi:hypothetical protein
MPAIRPLLRISPAGTFWARASFTRPVTLAVSHETRASIIALKSVMYFLHNFYFVIITFDKKNLIGYLSLYPILF